MPYGLPGAIKIDRGTVAHDAENHCQIRLVAGTILQPLHPCADQDGYDGHWCCALPETGQKIIVLPDAMPLNRTF